MATKKSDEIQFPVRISESIMDKLKYIAEYNGRSANREIEHMILKHIAEFEKAHEPITLEGFVPRSRRLK